MAPSLQHGPENGHPDHASAFTRLRRRITESRYFMASLLVHAIVVLVAGSIVIIQSVMPVEDFTSAGAIAGLPEGEKIDVRETPPDTQPKSEHAQQPSDVGGIVLDLVRKTASSDSITGAITPVPGK